MISKMFFMSFFFRASPAYNPYYYGYAPFPAYAQAQQYPYSYVQSDGTQPAGAQPPAAQTGWGEYLTNSFWSYVPSFGSQSSSESEQAAAVAPATPTCKKIEYKNKQNTKFNTLYMFFIRSRSRSSDKG